MDVLKKKGDQGNAVRDMQNVLAQRGYGHVP